MTRRKLPLLDLAVVQVATSLSVTALRLPQGDPLTGHRGMSDGLSLAAEAGPVALLAHLSRDERGLVLRGQVLTSAPGGLIGALVHVRGEVGAALAAATLGGEFVARGWEGPLRCLDVETEDGAWRLAWPSERPA